MSSAPAPGEYTLADFDFELPPELIAQHPAAERSGSRLLDGTGALPADRVFRELPALLQPGASRERPMPPYRPHGETWTIRTQLYAPDWSSMDVEMRGSQGPYAFWLTDTVAAIQRCTPPVAPAAPLP